MTNKKRVLVDLYKLKVLNCGLGQVALNFGHELAHNVIPDFEFDLLIPSNFNGYFGQNLKYTNASHLKRTFPWMNKGYDLWHATHQDSGFLPRNESDSYLLTVHDLNFVFEKSPQKIEKYLHRLQAKVDRACALVAISEFTANEMKLHLNLKGKEVKIIPNGVRLNDLNEKKIPLFVDSSQPFFFTIGQVVEKKNFHVLLDIMKNIPEFQLYICGEDKDEYASFIKNRIENELIKNVKVTGSISTSEKNWMYENCSAFLFPSKFEGFGLPVIEAMQIGKPVFSSNMTSLKEVGGKYAYFWENFEPQYMTNVIKNGVMDFDHNPQRKLDEIEYAQSFTYEKNVNSYIRLYSEIVGL